MTTICVGTELSALVQRIMIVFQVGALLMFAVVAPGRRGVTLVLVLALRRRQPQRADSRSAHRSVHLLGVGRARSTSTRRPRACPGLAAVLSTVILLVTHVLTTTAVVAYAGLGQIAEFNDDAGTRSARHRRARLAASTSSW